MTPCNDSNAPVPNFMDAHRSFGDVPTALGNRITVAASASRGEPKIAVHGRTEAGHHIGGLMGAEDTRALVAALCAAVEYAERIAAEQKAASVPRLERELREARAAASPGPGPSSEGT